MLSEYEMLNEEEEIGLILHIPQSVLIYVSRIDTAYFAIRYY